jgi:acetylornithine deacetylase/succinyl-diaminopimelate desuccinylase-like protein
VTAPAPALDFGTGDDPYLAELAELVAIPAALFERALGAKTLFFSFSTSDENLHAPNEFLRIARLREGMRAWEMLWRLLAAEGTLR